MVLEGVMNCLTLVSPSPSEPEVEELETFQYTFF